MGDARLLPGIMLSSVEDRGQYPSEGRASHTMRDLNTEAQNADSSASMWDGVEIARQDSDTALG